MVQELYDFMRLVEPNINDANLKENTMIELLKVVNEIEKALSLSEENNSRTESKNNLRKMLAEEMLYVAKCVGDVEHGLDAIKKGEMNDGDWKRFAIALLDLTHGPYDIIDGLFASVGKVKGVTRDDFNDLRCDTIDGIRDELVDLLGDNPEPVITELDHVIGA